MALAILHSKCGELHFFDRSSLFSALSTLQLDMQPAVEHGIKTEEASEGLGAAGKAFASLYDGFTIEQWAAYGKKKAKIATAVSKENGQLKQQFASILAGGSKDQHNGSGRNVDYVFESDPWGSPHSKKVKHNISGASTHGVVYDAWSSWKPTDSGQSVGCCAEGEGSVAESLASRSRCTVVPEGLELVRIATCDGVVFPTDGDDAVLETLAALNAQTMGSHPERGNADKMIPGESRGCLDCPRPGTDFIAEVHHQRDLSADAGDNEHIENKLNAVIERAIKKSEERMNAFCDGLMEEFRAK